MAELDQYIEKHLGTTIWKKWKDEDFGSDGLLIEDLHVYEDLGYLSVANA